jgi:hypothetical protein
MKEAIFTLISILVFSFSAFAQAESCPTIEVSGGGIIESGKPMSFTVRVTGKLNIPNLEYDWSVSNGTIASGQGTTSITVDTTGLAGGTNITAEVKIKGLSANCSDTASETGSTLIVCPAPRLIDEFGKLSRIALKARIEAFLTELEKETNAQGYFINYGTDGEIAAREKLIRDNIAFHRYDASRITFVRGGENPRGEPGVWTRFWIVPPGATPPTPN